ncbi:MAG: diguanylate cyclase [Alphaproteobacteria bacterium]|nr:diguanylate cyclase [Alphaproteobacteria bacterium]
MRLLKKLYAEYVFVLVVLMLGLTTSGFFAWVQQQSAQEATVRGFRIAAQDRIELITDKFDHNDIVLRSLSAFFRASEHVSREEFRIYTMQLLQDYSYIKALEWIPRVMNTERTAFEQAHGLHITELSGGLFGRAGNQESYFPVTYAEPETNNKRILGFNILSDEMRKLAITKGMNGRQTTATGRVNLLQVSNEYVPGIVFYEPVYKHAGHNADGHELEQMDGFIGSAVPMSDLIEAAIKPLNYSGVNIIIHDLMADKDEDRVLFVRSTRLKKIPSEEILEDYRVRETLFEQAIIDVAGRKLQITILPARGFFTMNVTPAVYLILIGGIGFTLLLVFYMYSHIKENERIAKEVETRTKELAKAKRETEMILLSTQEGVTGINQQGEIVFCNPTASQILGYSKKELLGQSHHNLLHGKRADGTAYMVEDSPIQHVLEYGTPCKVRDEVFWRKDGTQVQVEYTGSPIFEGGDIAGAVVIFRDITKQLEMEKQLEQMARHDQLTGLANRILFNEHLKNALARAERNKTMIAVLYMDLNGFKPVNDTLGHAAGDKILCDFGAILREVVRETDVPARLGGDEFAVLVDTIQKQEDALLLVERLLKRLEAPFEVAGENFPIGASIGISFYPDNGQDAETLVAHADAAMYSAKKDKKLSYIIYGNAA